MRITAAFSGISATAAPTRRNAFATAKPFQNLHNYGGTFGGPIRRDKTFFFFDFDGLKGVAATLFTPNVPTVAMRQGDFSAFAALKNPFTGVNPFVGNSIATGIPHFPGAQSRRISFSRCPTSAHPASPPPTIAHPLTDPKSTAPKRSSSITTSPTRHRIFLRYENRKDDYDIPGARSRAAAHHRRHLL